MLASLALYYTKRIALGLLVGLPLTGTLYQYVATKIDKWRYPPPGKMVCVGGHQLHINGMGHGNGPTVILEAGCACSSLEWSLVQPEVAKFSRVYSYDRAGMGWSDESPLPRAADNTVTELHTLLLNANVPRPYIFVGHSFGSILARLYTDKYPQDVAGMVLVDSAHENQLEDLLHISTKTLPNPTFIMTLTRMGIVRLLSSLPAARASLAAFPGQVKDAYRAHLNSASCVKTMWRERAQDAVKQTCDQLRKTGDLGNMPLIVIRHGKRFTAENGVSQEWLDRFYKDHEMLQNDLASKSTNGKLIIAEESGHMITREQPQIIVDAIREVVEAYKAEGNVRQSRV